MLKQKKLESIFWLADYFIRNKMPTVWSDTTVLDKCLYENAFRNSMNPFRKKEMMLISQEMRYNFYFEDAPYDVAAQLRSFPPDFQPFIFSIRDRRGGETWLGKLQGGVFSVPPTGSAIKSPPPPVLLRQRHPPAKGLSPKRGHYRSGLILWEYTCGIPILRSFYRLYSVGRHYTRFEPNGPRGTADFSPWNWARPHPGSVGPPNLADFEYCPQFCALCSRNWLVRALLATLGYGWVMSGGLAFCTTTLGSVGKAGGWWFWT